MKNCKLIIAYTPRQVIGGLYMQRITQKQAAKRCGVEYSLFVKMFKKIHFSGRQNGDINREKVRKGLLKLNIKIQY